MSLMYYFVLFIPTSQHPDNNVLNVYWRGLCVEDLGKFCRPTNPLTMTQATLLAPLAILITLFIPTIIYVLVLSTCNAKKGMKVTDRAILFIFPIFTNLYYNFKSEVRVDTRPKNVECRARTRSHSSPNISTPAYGGFHNKRFQALIVWTWAWKETFMLCIICIRWKDEIKQVCVNWGLDIIKGGEKKRFFGGEARTRVFTFPQQHPVCLLLCRWDLGFNITRRTIELKVMLVSNE